MAALLFGNPCSLTTTTTTTIIAGRATIVTTGLSSFRPLLPTISREKRNSSRRQRLLRCALKVDITPPGETQGSIATSPFGLDEHDVSYRHTGGNNADEGGKVGKGWTDAAGNLDERWIAKFRALAVLSGDRVEMHSVLAIQRSNWNHLFHQTIVIAGVSAAIAAAINGAEPGPGLTLLAISLNLFCAGIMALVNKEQPSQLAEEQRRAARFFKRLLKDVESTLEIDPKMREDAEVYWEDKVGTLHALDGAFPLPLSPGGLEKFPREVVPPELRRPLEGTHLRHHFGWTHKTEDYLRDTMKRLHTRDIPNLIRWAQRAKRLNLAMARVSPFLAVAGALCSIPYTMPGLSLLHVSWLGAAFTVNAVFTFSVSHALQLGSAFEMYRDYAGYYEDIEKNLERVLQLPAHMRGDMALFLGKVNLQLGHQPSKETVKDNDHRAGKLF